MATAALAMGALLLGPAALAAEKPRRILVADAVPQGVEPALAQTVTSVLVTKVGNRPGIQAFSGAELRKLVALEAERQALDCTGDDCMAEMSTALGAPQALFTDVGRLGTLIVVNVTLMDVTAAVPVGRASVQAARPEDLLQQLDGAVNQLLPPAAPAAPPPGAMGGGRAPAKTEVEAAPRPRDEAVAPSQPKASDEAAPAKAKLAGAPPPPAAPVQPAPTVDAARVAAVVKANQKDIKKCRALAPRAKGSLTVRVLLSTDGAVGWTFLRRSNVEDVAVRKCLMTALAGWRFPGTGQPAQADVTLDLQR